ncbi:MAG: MFS transporter [Phycisphaerae bacterium]
MRDSRIHALFGAQPGELRPALWAAAYFFFVLASWYVLRPLRDAMGLVGGTRNLPYLFVGTLVITVLLNPLFSQLVSRYSRRVFIPATYRFFSLNLLIFFVLIRALPPDRQVWLARVFFVWASAYTLFAVAVFWGLMADLFEGGRAKRLFPFIGVGGTLGAIAGSSMTTGLAERIGMAQLILVAIVLLELALLAMRQACRYCDELRSLRSSPQEESGQSERALDADERRIGGTAWDGLIRTLRSPYLIGISLYILAMTVTSSLLYFEQGRVVDEAITDRAARAAFFARIDLFVNVLCLISQTLIAGRILTWAGVGANLALMPLITASGFAAQGGGAALTAIFWFQVARRAGEYALARPGREVLFTVVSRADKYKAKSLIDTFVYRGGDAMGAGLYSLLSAKDSFDAGQLFRVVLAISAAWMVVCVLLDIGYRLRASRVVRDARPGRVLRASAQSAVD